MKSLIIMCFIFFSLNAFAREFGSSTGNFIMDGRDLNALSIVSKAQCGSKFKDYNFENEFKLLFKQSYLKRDVSKIKTMSQNIEKELKTFCDKNHYLVTGFKEKNCQAICSKNYSSDEQLKEQCQAACTSIDAKINSLADNMATLVNMGAVETHNLKDGSCVDNDSRGKAKEKDQSHDVKETDAVHSK